MTSRVPLSRWILFLSIVVAGTTLDQVAKKLVFARFSVGQVRPLIDGVLELRPAHNLGALYGVGSNIPRSGLVFAGLSIVAALAILYWLFVKGAARDGWLTATLALVTAGAAGNCIDRLRLGYVRDFLLMHAPIETAVFNFADNMLVLGAIGLMILSLRPDPVLPEEEPGLGSEAATASGDSPAPGQAS